MNEEVILSIDPGKDKCGIALLTSEGKVISHSVIATVDLYNKVSELSSNYIFSCIVLGDRTYSSKIKKILSNVPSLKGIVFVDEHLTTVLARKRYFAQNPPKGWKRFIPTSLQVPPEPYDDYAAIILAERFLMKELDPWAPNNKVKRKK